MDATTLTAAIAGAVAGFVASTVPGLHVNTLAVATLAVAPAAGGPGVAFLVAAFAASPFGLAVSGTFLGPTTDEGAVQSLPAHALAREGRAAEAVALQAWGALAGILVALALAWPVRLALAPLAPRLPALLPWLLALVVLLLVASERARLPVRRHHVVVPWRHGTRHLSGILARADDDHHHLRIGRTRVHDPHGLLVDCATGARVGVRVETSWTTGRGSRTAGRAAALGIIALSGALGLAAFRIGAASPLGLPTSPLLPLLAGLFAAPELVAAASSPAHARVPAARLRAPRVHTHRLVARAAPGALAGALLGLVPGVSASHAALLAPRGRTQEAHLVTLAAVNGAGVVFTMLAWHALDKARSGALVAAQRYQAPIAWRAGLPPPELLQEAALVVAAAALACALARSLSGPASRVLARAPRTLARVGLGILLASVALFAGAAGMGVFLAAGLVGALPRRIGVRRSHAMGCILVPVLLRAWGIL